MSKKICVIGAGHWGSNHIMTLAELDSLGGIVDNDLDRLASLKGAYPDVPRFNSLDQALQENFDGFTVATPAETHFSLGKLLLENKKHVLIEKPLTLNVSDAQVLKKLAAAAGANISRNTRCCDQRN